MIECLRHNFFSLYFNFYSVFQHSVFMQHTIIYFFYRLTCLYGQPLVLKTPEVQRSKLKQVESACPFIIFPKTVLFFSLSMSKGHSWLGTVLPELCGLQGHFVSSCPHSFSCPAMYTLPFVPLLMTPDSTLTYPQGSELSFLLSAFLLYPPSTSSFLGL